MQDQTSNLDVLAASVEAAMASGSFPLFDPQAGETVLPPTRRAQGVGSERRAWSTTPYRGAC